MPEVGGNLPAEKQKLFLRLLGNNTRQRQLILELLSLEVLADFFGVSAELIASHKFVAPTTEEYQQWSQQDRARLPSGRKPVSPTQSLRAPGPHVATHVTLRDGSEVGSSVRPCFLPAFLPPPRSYFLKRAAADLGHSHCYNPYDEELGKKANSLRDEWLRDNPLTCVIHNLEIPE